VWIDSAQIREVWSGQAVLVTGAGGSIGSELCRQIARFQPRKIIFFEQSGMPGAAGTAGVAGHEPAGTIAPFWPRCFGLAAIGHKSASHVRR